MASTSRLDDIAVASDQLSTLGDRQRGEAIEAAAWNALVDVLKKVLEIDRGQETSVAQSLIDSFASLTHEHLGAVTLSWLDPDVQVRISGDGGSISLRSALADVTARVADVVDQVAALSQRVENAQRRNDDSSVDELARSAKLRQFEDRFTGVEGMRGLVTSLSADILGIQPQLQTVLDLRTSLTTDTGAPLDVRALGRHVDAIDAAQKDAVLGVDGTPLRLRDVQVTLSEIKDVLGIGAGGGLDARLATLAAQLQGQLDTRLDDRIGTLRQEVDAQLAAQAAAADDKLTALDRSVDARVDQAIDVITARVLDQATNKITEQVLAKVQGQLPDLVAGQVKGQLAEIQKALKTLDTRVRTLEAKVFG